MREETIIDYRARLIAAADGQSKSDVDSAPLRVRRVSVQGDILAAANGSLQTVAILDKEDPAAAPGDYFRLQSLGEHHYVCLAMVSGRVNDSDDHQWGVKDVYFNGNQRNRMSFQSTLGQRGHNARFFSIEALRSGLDPWPFLDLPAFGPNSTLDIVAFNTTIADVTATVQFHLIPVSASYVPPSENCDLGDLVCACDKPIEMPIPG